MYLCTNSKTISGPRRFLGAAAPADPTSAVIAQVCPAGITGGACGCSTDSSEWQQVFSQSVASRFLMWPPPSSKFADCSGVSGPNADQTASKVIGSAGALTATGAIAAGAAAGSAVPVIGTIIGAIGGLLFGIFGASHAKAVQAQNVALCNGVPQTNSVLQQIDQALAAGQITPAQAASQYAALGSQFTSAMKQGTSYKKCDALYGYNLAMQMVIAARNQDLQNGVLTGGRPAPWATPASSGALASLESSLGVSGTSLPLLAIAAAAGLALLL